MALHESKMTEGLQSSETGKKEKTRAFKSKVKIYKTIGEFPGFKTKAGWEMIDREGVICNV